MITTEKLIESNKITERPGHFLTVNSDHIIVHSSNELILCQELRLIVLFRIHDAGNIRSIPPPCISNSSPRYLMLIAEHSRCHPENHCSRRRPSQRCSGLAFFHNAKSNGFRFFILSFNITGIVYKLIQNPA